MDCRSRLGHPFDFPGVLIDTVNVRPQFPRFHARRQLLVHRRTTCCHLVQDFHVENRIPHQVGFKLT